LINVLGLVVDIVTGFLKLCSKLRDIRLLTIDFILISNNRLLKARLLSSQGLVVLIALKLNSGNMGNLLTKSCAFGYMFIKSNGQGMDLALLRFEILFQMRDKLFQFLDLSKEFLNVLF
jgi:hypothetical protein